MCLNSINRVTVAICTWNRGKILGQTLSRFRDLRIPPGTNWELIVVNNNSTDNTREVLESFKDSLPLIVLEEFNQGQCHARNHAIRFASGDWILWTDDDVIVSEDWLASYVSAIVRFPNACFGGGIVDPWFPVKPPNWIVENIDMLEGPFAIRNLGSETRLLRDEEEVYGANMAFRTETMRSNPFDVGRGLVGNNNIRGDETELVSRLRLQGKIGFWAHECRVKHYILPSRLNAKYVFDYYRGAGFAMTPTINLSQKYPSVFGIPRWMIRRYVNLRLSLMFTKHGCRRWLQRLQELAICAGNIDFFRQSAFRQ